MFSAETACRVCCQSSRSFRPGWRMSMKCWCVGPTIVLRPFCAVWKSWMVFWRFILIWMKSFASVREEDEPKVSLMKTFSLTDIQAEAVLNMRLRSLRRLEEMEIRKERNALADERKSLETLLGSEKRRWTRMLARIWMRRSRSSEVARWAIDGRRLHSPLKLSIFRQRLKWIASH
ncbi:type iia topoisomerase (DNA gyrase/topo ii [Gluconobacter frateurii NBRC 103465]|nr:type iia topoisomerase (DNA gyrase/topo ii [Gluconobacter frateurii NBRC 103465]